MSKEEEVRATIDRINALSAERSRLYTLAARGGFEGREALQRVHDISRQLDQLWEVRRQERAGRRDGIDLLADHVYRQAYGRDYEDAVAPVGVAPAADERAAA